jgi:hypothetical protein
MIDDYLTELGRELRAVGIRGSLRRRVLAESIDHLSSDPDALQRFGSAHEVANAFAAELGARASRRAAVGAFAALAAAGAVYAVAFVGASVAGIPDPDTFPVAALVAFAAIVFAPQIAFVAGTLAVVRTLRCRAVVIPSSELRVINRRTGLALVGGLVTMGALALFAFELRGEIATWWVRFTIVGATAAAGLLVLAAIPAIRATRLRPQVAGQAGDIFDDLGLPRTDPGRFALLVALTVGLMVAIAGAVQGDPIDGASRAFAEALACLGGFAVFGRYLGLRS